MQVPVPAILILIGLCFEAVGAFILAVDAIGTARVASWGERIQALIPKGRELPPYKLTNLLSIPLLLLVGWLVMSGFRGTMNQAYAPKNWFDRVQAYVLLPIMAFVGVLLFVGVLVNLAYMTSAFLEYVERKTEAHAAGVMGFSFMAAGFIFQVVGTALPFLQ